MGRHSASDDDDERPVVTRPPGRPPRPGRHTDDDGAMAPGAVQVKPGPNPRLEPARVPAPAAAPAPAPAPAPEPAADGLDLIEDVLYGEPADAALVGAQDATAQIPVITAPLLDEPVPEAVTEQIPAVPAEDQTVEVEAPPEAPPAKPSPKPAPAPAAAPDEPAAADVPAAPDASAPDLAPAAARAQSDLVLLRTRSDVRARVAAAVVIPFVLYVLVLLIIDALSWRVLLIWIWAPLITAGVVAGILLDSAHRDDSRDSDEAAAVTE